MSAVKILVVEDEMIVARDIESRLENLGYAVAGVVSTGEEALGRAVSTRPDLVLMDIMLKGETDGIQAADEINRELDIPVVYLTAYADETTLGRAKITGPYGYIVKPFEQRSLHTTIETALYKHKLEKRLKESEERYRTLQENLPIGVFRATPGGKLVSVNPALTEMFGYPSGEELLELPLLKLFAEPDQWWKLRRSLRLSGVVTNYEVELVRRTERSELCPWQNEAEQSSARQTERSELRHWRNGEFYWGALSVRAVKDEAGNILYFDGTLRDVTAQKRALELEKEYIHDLAFLSKTALEFVAQTPEENLNAYVAQKLKAIVPGCRLVVVTSLDEGTSRFTVRSLLGLGEQLESVLKLLGRDPLELEIPLIADIEKLMKKGRLCRISGEYERHSSGAIPQIAAKKIRRLLGLGHTYLMGILRKDRLLGSVIVVLEKGRTLDRRDIAEAFINQAAVALMRRRAEEEHRASEKRYRQLFHYMSIGVSLLEAIDDGGDFVIRDFNRAAEKIEGLEPAEVIGKRVTEVFPGLAEAGMLDVFRKVWRRGGSEYLPAWLYRDSRLSGWRESYIYKLPSGEIVNAYQDTTQEIQAARALKESEERYRSVVETARDAIVTVDADGFIRFWNRAAERTFGYAPSGIVGRPLSLIIPELVQPAANVEPKRTERSELRLRRTGAMRSKTEQLTGQRSLEAVHADGHAFPIEVSGGTWKLGDKEYFTSIIRDITERRQMEKAIIHAKREWERTFDTVPDMIVITDLGGRVIRANKSLAARLGHDVRELIGRSFRELLQEAPAPPGSWEEKEVFHQETYVKKLDGHFSFTLTPFYDHAGGITGTVTVGRDITEQRRAEESLKRSALVGQAEHIFSSIRHEMGNALNTLKTTLTVLRKNYESFEPEKRETYFIRCLDTFKVAERLLGVMKEYQKFDKLELAPVYVDRFLTEKSGLFQDLARNAGVTCEVELSLFDGPIFIDSDALIQVLLNVVDNAIAAARDVKKPHVTIGCRRVKDRVVITVTDNGRGIPEQDLPKVFTPLYTTKPDGSGLGMAIVLKRMMQMGGEANIFSIPNQGTRVELRLPLHAEER